MARTAGVIGGLFTLLGAAGVVSLWMFILGPHTTILNDFGTISNLCFQILIGIPSVTGDYVIDPFTDPELYKFMNQLFTEFLYLTALEAITSPKFLGIEAMYLMYGAVGLLVVGGILALAAAAED